MGGESSSTQAQQSQTAPWAAAQPMLQAILGQIGTGLNNTGLTGAETGAIDQLSQNAAKGNPYAGQIGGYAQSLLGGGGANAQAGNVQSNLDAFANRLQPYASGSMIGNNPALAAQLAQIQSDVANSVNSQFAAAGRDLSGANQMAYARGVAAGQAPVIAAQYNQDANNQINAANALYNAGNTTASTLSGMQQNYLTNQGQGVSTAQSALDAQNYGANATLAAEAQRRGIPVQALSLLAQIGVPVAGLGSQSTGTTTGTQQMSGAQQFATLAGGIGNLLKFIPSDRRLKEDIIAVGALFDGTPVYRYRYKGAAAYHIGLLAQDVEKAMPEAVISINGYKAVDYRAATERSREMVEVAEQRADAGNEATVREYLDRDGNRAPQNESVTLARASRDYAEARAVEKLVAESATSQTLAARVDTLRAEALAHDPDAAEFYGFEPPEAEADQARQTPGTKGAPSGPDDEGPDTELAPEVEKALQHPQIRQAIEEQLGEVEKARQDYIGGLSAATQIAQMSFLSQFPELASVTPDQLPAALEQMSRQDPAKFERVQAMVAAGQGLIAQQQYEGQRQAEIARDNFRNYARSEDMRFESMLKGESVGTQRAVAVEIAASARASGIEANELIRLFNSEPLMRNAVFQRMMYDAGKYRLMMKARDAAVAKAVPPVQRPGAAQNRAEREHAELRTLNARLSSSGDIKDAVALYHARKSNRR